MVGDGPEIGWESAAPPGSCRRFSGSRSIAAGLALWTWTVRLFATRGKGPLAPWDPTRQLVVEGPYRQVRNPMITWVVAVLLGEAALLGSPGILIWAGAFTVLNHLFFVLVEEPVLERRFGDEYREYKRRAPMDPPSGAMNTPRLGVGLGGSWRRRRNTRRTAT